MASKSTKQKTTASRSATQVLSANLSNSSFGFLPATGLKGKSPAGSPRNLNVQPDLDLVGGFAFLSFASLAQLESHIEHNERKFTTVSIDVGQKRKAEYPKKELGDNPDDSDTPNKKKATATKKKPAKKISSATQSSTLAANPKGTSSPSKKETPSVGRVLNHGEHSGQTNIFRSHGGERTLEHSPNSDVEISLLCSETVPDLGDDEEISGQLIGSKVEAAADYDKQVSWDGSAQNSSIQVNDNIIEEANQKPKKRKKKKKSEHCDQTSQTKFRIKKKKKLSSQSQGSVVGFSNVTVDKFSNGSHADANIHERDNNKSQTKQLPKSIIEKVNCARTTAYQGANKNYNLKNRSSEISLASSTNITSREVIQAKNVRISVDVFTPDISNRENDVDMCDIETRSNSMLSDISDHSSDIEPFDPDGCFLLNNKVERVEKEDFQEGGEIVNVDIETVGKEAKKNFLVVSGIEAGHFSYHPGETKEGTIDTSIQAFSNEIDIFLQCAKMQEGQIIKIINPDDSLELPSHVTQKHQGRDPNLVKATRSATERRRRHHLGDLFQDMKMEVFTDLMESDLYFSKQSILSKAISTLEELVQEGSDFSKTKELLLQQNKELKEKRNMLMFGKTSVDVDDVKVELIFNQLNINVEISAEKVECLDEKTSQEQEVDTANVKQGTDNESSTIVEPSARGRPKAKKNFLPSCLLKPALKPKDDTSKATTNVPNRISLKCDAPEATLMTTGSSQVPLAVKTTNVSCGVQTLGEETSLFKTGNPTLSEIRLLGGSELKGKSTNESTCPEAAEPSQAENSPKVIHTIAPLTQTAPAPKNLSVLTQSQNKEVVEDPYKPSGTFSVDNSALKNTAIDQPMSQEGGAKQSLVKILPKPAIVQLNPSQQMAIMESLGQIKQPSSDKIICNLSRLSTQTNSSTPSRICIIRSNQLMKSLDSKDVMHLKITNDALRNLGTSSSNMNATSTVSNMPQVSTAPNVLLMSGAQRPELLTSKPHLQQKYPENTVLATVSSTQPVFSEVKTIPGVLLLKSIKEPEAPASTVQMAQKHPEKPIMACRMSSPAVSSGPNVLLLRSTQKPEVSTPVAQMQQMVYERTMLAPSAIHQPLLSDPKIATNTLSMNSAQTPGFMTPAVQIQQKQPEETVLPTAASNKTFLSDVNTIPKAIVPTSAKNIAPKHPEETAPLCATSSQSVSSGMQTELLPFLLTSTRKPEMLTFTAQAVQQNHEKTMPALPVANQPASSSFTRTVPGPVVVGNTHTKCEVGPSTMQIPQSHSKGTMLVSQILPKPTSATPTHKAVISGKQVNLLSSGSTTEKVSSPGLTSADDVTLRALASLNQLQANKPVPPLTEAVSNPVFSNKNPIAGYLTGLKNVVMNVDSGGTNAHPTSSVYTIPIVTVTSSLKTATRSQVVVTTSGHKSLEKHTMSAVCSTPLVFIPSSISLNSCFTSSSPMSSEKSVVSPRCLTVTRLPVSSVTTSASLKSSFTMSALNTPIPSTGVSGDLHPGVMPLVNTSLDPFNLVPKQLPLSSSAIPSEPRNITSSLNIRAEVPKQVNECDTVSPLLIPDEISKPIASCSSTVLTQEMLNIPGIKQNADLSNALLNPPEFLLPDMLPNLDKIDETIDSMKLTELSCVANKEKAAGSNMSCSGKQADVSSYTLRSSSTNASKQTSPLKVAIKDFRKDKSLVEK